MTRESAIQRLIAIAAVCAMSLAISAPAWAGFKLAFTEDKYLNVGVGLRTAFNARGPDGEEWSKKFAVEDVRLYTNGQVLPMLGFEVNFDYATGNIAPGSQSDGVVTLLDGVVKFELNDYFNIWGGQFLPPSDRANLSGPYYLNTWAFPYVQKYPAVYAGRDRGAAFWGQVKGGMFKYQVGVFNGTDPNNPKDVPLVAARVVLNLLDPEPGYYNASTYYGTKDILALGFVFQYQTDGANPKNFAGANAPRNDFYGWNFDLLAEKRLGDDGSAGTATLDAAFYWYDLDGAQYVPNQSLNEGYGYTIFLGYLLPWKVGYKSLKGQFQPHIQWQDFHFKGNPWTSTGAGATRANPRDRQRIDAGVHYVLDSFNARATLVYFNELPSTRYTKRINGVTLAMQIQF